MPQPARHGDKPCPVKTLAIAINRHLSHVGFFYTRDGKIRLCDFQNDKCLAERDADPSYYWISIDMDEEDASLIASSLRQVYRLHPNDLPYSLRYTPNAFDDAGNLIRCDAGFTCATFIVAVLEANEFSLADLKTWPSRPEIEEELRSLILNQDLPEEVRARIKSEKVEFRLLPVEICGAADAPPYPAKFDVAKPAGDGIAAQIRAIESARSA